MTTSLWSNPQIFAKQYSIESRLDDNLVIHVPETIDESKISSFNQTSDSLVNIIASITFVSVFIDTLNPILPEPMYVRATVYLFLGLFCFVLLNLCYSPPSPQSPIKLRDYKMSLNAYTNKQMARNTYNNMFLSIPPFFCYYAVDGYQQLLMPHMNASIFWKWMAVIVIVCVFFILQFMNTVRRSRETFEKAVEEAVRKKQEEKEQVQVVIGD